MFEVCCRLCLEQVPLSRVQSLYDKHHDYIIRDKITELFQIKFSDTEKLSTVCNDCLEKIESANKIRAFFLESNERFRRIMLGCEDKKESKGSEDSLVVNSAAETDDGDAEDVKLELSDSAAKVDTTITETGPSDHEEEEEHLVVEEEEPMVEDSPNLSVSIYDGSEETGSEHKPDGNEEEVYTIQEIEQDDSEDAVEVLSEIYSSEQGCELEEEKLPSDEVVELDEVIKRTVSIGAPGDDEFSVVTIEYQCNVCNEVFEDRVSLVCHTNGTHIQEYPKNCRHCLSVFKSDAELKEHDCLEKPRIFKCSRCNRGFQTVKELQNHTKTHKRTYKIPTAKLQPPPAHRSSLYNQCEHCPKSFANNRMLVQHAQDVHPEVQILTCERCDQQFVNAPSLHSHKAAHEKNYECRFCGKVCPTAVALAGHENTHTRDQPFQCNECGRNFAQYTSMRRHMKIHFNEKKYSCDLCAARFRQRSVMLTHRRIHTGEKPFECGVCKKNFRDHSTLAKHRRIHEKGGVVLMKS